jgi:hypothetical protein
VYVRPAVQPGFLPDRHRDAAGGDPEDPGPRQQGHDGDLRTAGNGAGQGKRGTGSRGDAVAGEANLKSGEAWVGGTPCAASRGRSVDFSAKHRIRSHLFPGKQDLDWRPSSPQWSPKSLEVCTGNAAHLAEKPAWQDPGIRQWGFLQCCQPHSLSSWEANPPSRAAL